jgi:hypothetical protein
MYKRKKKPKVKARVSRGSAARGRRSKVKQVKRVTKRRKPMAKKKSTSSWEEEDAPAPEADEGQDGEANETGAGDEEEVPVPTETAATDAGVYRLDSPEIAIKGTVYKQGDTVALTPEELESVQASGVRILPVE